MYLRAVIATTESAVIVASLNQSPAHTLLTLDVGFSSLTLRIFRIERLF
jgi:hypothetical protein